MPEESNLSTEVSHVAYSTARAVVPFMVTARQPSPAEAVRPIVEDLLSRHGVEGVSELVGQLAIARALGHSDGILGRRQQEGGDLSDDQVTEQIIASIDAYELRIMGAAEAFRDRFGPGPTG